MNISLPIDTVAPRIPIGLLIVPDFLTPEQEGIILGQIPKRLETERKGDRNSVHRFGSNIPYQNAMISHKIPEYLNELVGLMIDGGYLEPMERPDSISINEYYPGNQITPHIDSNRSGDVISIISLKGYCEFHFIMGTHYVRYHFPARALLQIRGEARWDWKHAVPPVKEDRYSIVFRKSKKV